MGYLAFLRSMKSRYGEWKIFKDYQEGLAFVYIYNPQYSIVHVQPP